MVITPDGRTLYVLNYGPGTVTPVQTATNRAGQPIRIGRWPDSIVITPNGRTVYVSRFSNGGTGTVTPISTATNTAGPPIKAGVSPRTLVVAPGTPAR